MYASYVGHGVLVSHEPRSHSPMLQTGRKPWDENPVRRGAPIPVNWLKISPVFVGTLEDIRRADYPFSQRVPRGEGLTNPEAAKKTREYLEREYYLEREAEEKDGIRSRECVVRMSQFLKYVSDKKEMEKAAFPGGAPEDINAWTSAIFEHHRSVGKRTVSLKSSDMQAYVESVEREDERRKSSRTAVERQMAEDLAKRLVEYERKLSDMQSGKDAKGKPELLLQTIRDTVRGSRILNRTEEEKNAWASLQQRAEAFAIERGVFVRDLGKPSSDEEKKKEKERRAKAMENAARANEAKLLEAKRRKEEEEEARKKQEQEAKRASEEAKARREEEAKKKQEQEAKRKSDEEKARRQEATHAAEAARRAREESENRRALEEERGRSERALREAESKKRDAEIPQGLPARASDPKRVRPENEQSTLVEEFAEFVSRALARTQIENFNVQVSARLVGDPDAVRKVIVERLGYYADSVDVGVERRVGDGMDMLLTVTPHRRAGAAAPAGRSPIPASPPTPVLSQSRQSPQRRTPSVRSPPPASPHRPHDIIDLTES